MPLKQPTGQVLSPPRPLWVTDVSKRIQGFVVHLPENWNSYGAQRIQPELAEAAIRLLPKVVQPGTPKPEVVPTTAGGVQIEWHVGGIDLEINILTQDKINVSFEDLGSGQGWSREISLADLDVLIQTVSKIPSQE
jgi:hypothetical protein